MRNADVETTEPTTHVIVHTKHADEEIISSHIAAITKTVFAVTPRKVSFIKWFEAALETFDWALGVLFQFLCVKCKSHIAFNHDLLQPPCLKLLGDRKLFGMYENDNFVVLRYVYRLQASEAIRGKHSCRLIKCKLEK